MNKAQLIDAVQKSLGKEATKKCAGDCVAAVSLSHEADFATAVVVIQSSNISNTND